MASSNYEGFCTSPQDPIAKAPAGPKFSTSAGNFDGEDGYPKKTDGTPIKEKIYDKSFGGTPTDETRNTSA